MTTEEKNKLLTALCGYYPHGVIIEVEGYHIGKLKGIDNYTVSTDRGINYPLRLVKPYLRPMKSVTEKEWSEIIHLRSQISKSVIGEHEVVDYYNAHFLDYRLLILDNLAKEAKDWMYDFSNKKEDVPLLSCNFSIDDRIRLKGNTGDHIGFCIVDIREGIYWCDAGITIPCSQQHLFETF